MKCMISRSITILFLVLSTKSLTEGIDINNYFLLINDVHRYYRTSCIIFVRSDKYDLNMTAPVYTWSYKLSQQRVMTATRTFSDLTSEYDRYQKNITRPLFVVLLDTEETMIEFSVTTKTIKPMSFPFWLVMFLQFPGNPLEKYCKHPTNNVFNVDFGTQMLVLCYDRPNLIEWYAIRDNRTRTFDLATWSPDTGMILRTLEHIYVRRSDMFGDVMRVGSVSNSPLISHENHTLGGMFGALLTGALLTELSKVMNFTVKVLDPLEGFGALNEHRTGWTGVVGQILTNEADFGVSSFTRTIERQDVVDFTVTLIRSKYYLFYKQADIDDVTWSTYFRTFSFEVWISIVILIIIATIILTIMKTKRFSTTSIFENYTKVWGIYCQQSLPDFPKESPMRLVFLSVYVSSITAMAMYSASVISSLATSTPKLLFSSMEDFVNDGSYKFLVALNSAEYELPKNTKDAVFIKLYTLRDKKKYLPSSLLEGLKQICNRERVAFYTTEFHKESLHYKMQCTTGRVSTGRYSNIGFILAKGSPYTSFINYHLRRFRVQGVISKLKNEHMRANVPLSETIFENVNLQAVAPILTIVIGSMILALFILIIEKLYYSFKTRSENNKLFIKKFSNNLKVKNKFQKSNIDLNLMLKEFYYNRPFGYLP
ncbi:glutamate receptor 1-like [Solenopsis invicta]|uniref:glutamate receptor 1-like n=1 Tax=Solenopsis invicta TaxID=13686 RepID=UPI00193D19FE|nr:glutamate receptor 1-like [Solenopsis invicta]